MSTTTTSLPDVTATESVQFNRVIDWVGMTDVEVSLMLNGSRLTPANVDLFVDLSNAESKGIHMSRLYLTGLKTLRKEPLSMDLIKDLLHTLIEGQKGNSLQSKVVLNFDLPLKRKALVSQTFGERHYPIEIIAVAIRTGDGNFLYDFEVRFKALYSSTCPCSAALARQLVKNKWKEFADESDQLNFSIEDVADWLEQSDSIVATPHAQRSQAYLKLLPKDFSLDKLEEWIDTVEMKVLKTPVQTAVKREDEQEFARLNGTNLMFCEDAARRVAHWLDDNPEIEGYWARMEHWESLHAHNAVSVISNNWKI
jgi:GTP cyclohydrolase I